ncbi:ArsA family ATPase [cf. Phormidesmis sp. LEGE 11477]|uniref:Get3/ArsA fold putative tail anchor-mediating ATPase NosAFP n=1 Tax=cf. Phormidesmis sp. LEGE 11477 TaxID=1828680 RepID=UPI00187F21FF|nr:ArsA family ATPase [cf. Phormidesmis sp. LEGE 11477]MBE9061983.1 ArsA family ATPase [cf. Phormidesmis sp. LEGE 11477]
MTLILTFLGKGGTGRTTVAIAAAQKLTDEGKRVLLISQEAGPALSLLTGTEVGTEPIAVSVAEKSFQAVQLQTTQLVDKNWEKLKQFEARYLRDPFFKAVFGQELSVVPGMDDFLALNAIREYTESSRYDVIVHDGPGNQASLRMWGAIGGIDWYFRRFKQVFQDSQFYRSISPFIGPVTGAVFSSGLSGDVWNQPETQSVEGMVAKGKAMVKDPMQLRAYVVTTSDKVAIATGKYLWSAAQQIGLTVAGAIVTAPYGGQVDSAAASTAFDPIPVSTLNHSDLGSELSGGTGGASGGWRSLAGALPALAEPVSVPSPMSVDVANSTVKLFLPGFDKTQVKLTQYGPEVTVEAGDQRHNVSLPPTLKGRSVTGAKFQSGYLIISFS